MQLTVLLKALNKPKPAGSAREIVKLIAKGGRESYVKYLGYSSNANNETVFFATLRVLITKFLK
jgi:hypothetical protein